MERIEFLERDHRRALTEATAWVVAEARLAAELQTAYRVLCDLQALGRP